MIARCEFGYESRDFLAKKSTEDWDFFEQVKKILHDTRTPTQEVRHDSFQWPTEAILSLEEVQALSDLGVSVTIKKIRGAIALEQVIPQGKVTVHVQVPHIGLFAVNEVYLEENCCTDRLQQRLDEGWHLLCVCPPNAARRPDYILGRTKVEDR